MATRLEQYRDFLAGTPSESAVLTQVKAERAKADRALLLARLRFSYVDYHPFAIARRLSDGDTAGDSVETSGSVTLRSGWVRWADVRKRIDAVDAWIAAPDSGQASSVLREIMVEIPDTIEDQSDYLGKLKTYAKEEVKEAIDTLSPVLIPVAVIAAVLFFYSRK